MNYTKFSTENFNSMIPPIHFKYRDAAGQISMQHVLAGIPYMGIAEPYDSPQLLMDAYDLDKEQYQTFVIRDIIHEPLPLKELTLGDHVRYIPEFKSQRMLEGIVCFVDGERIYFYSGIMPEEFYGTDMAKRPGKNIVHNEQTYNWELMIHPRKRLEII